MIEGGCNCNGLSKAEQDLEFQNIQCKFDVLSVSMN